MEMILAANTGLVSVITTAIKTFYADVSGMFTLLCVVVLVICLIGEMVSKNQRTVEEFKAWKKRVVGTWVIFNLLGSIITYGNTLFPPQTIAGLGS